MTTKSKSLKTAKDVVDLLKARNPLIWIVSREEDRIEEFLMQAGAAAGYTIRFWDVAQGVLMKANGKPNEALKDPGALLNEIEKYARRVPSPVPTTANTANEPVRNLWILRDLPVWLQGLPMAPTLRQLRNLVKMLPSVPVYAAQSLVILSPDNNVPPELSTNATVIEWPLPDRAEMAGILEDAIRPVIGTKDGKGREYTRKRLLSADHQEAAIDAAVGLSGEEAKAFYAKSLVSLGRIDPITVAKEKRRVITREKVLEWFDPLPGGLDDVGGLDVLKTWLVNRKLAFTPEAREYGLPKPKGCLLVGISGCGKSLTAKATATAFEAPLLRMDLGALKDKFVGASEQNLRRAFEVVKAIGRCVLWIDEIEKALQGATSGSADGGVSADALGTILSWMQDGNTDAFVMATANDVSSLPPELLRKGRFDEIWWVGFPTPQERIEILKTALRSYGREDLEINYQAIANATEKFTGSEIAAIVPEAMFAAFADDKREIETDDLITSAKTVKPLAETAKDKIDRLLAWSREGGARAATSPAKAERFTPTKGRVLELSEDLEDE